MSYKYDVFISYRHSALDSAVATKLQRKLERYRIPKEIQKAKGKKRIQRVFRDQEELSVGYDLSQEIEEQLKESEFMVVLCSRESRQSKWVEKEVDTFLKYHSAKNILPILLDGEPEESFPRRLLTEGEPFAADIRAENENEVLRKLDHEIYRIIAPVLYCAYDELIQRHKKYRLQKILQASIATFLLLLAFTSYVIYKNNRENKAYQKQLLEESKLLTKEAEESLNSGDTYNALQYLLASLPSYSKGKESIKRPFYPKAYYLLNQALDPYRTTSNKKSLLSCQKVIPTDEKMISMVVSPDDSCLIANDSSHLHVWDSDKKTLLYTYEYESVNEDKVDDKRFFQKDKIILVDGDNLVCYNYKKGDIEWKNSIKAMLRNVIVLPDENKVCVYTWHYDMIAVDLNSGIYLSNDRIEFYEGSHPDLSAYNSDGKYFVFEDYSSEKSIHGYYLYDFERKEANCIDEIDNEEADIFHNEVACSPDSNYIIVTQKVINGDLQCKLLVDCIGLETKEKLWTKTYDCSDPENDIQDIIFGEDDYKDRMIIGLGNIIYELSLQDGAVQSTYYTKGMIKSLSWEDKKIKAISENGYYFNNGWFHKSDTEEVTYFDTMNGMAMNNTRLLCDNIDLICRGEKTEYYLTRGQSMIYCYSSTKSMDNLVSESTIYSNSTLPIELIDQCQDDSWRVSLYSHSTLTFMDYYFIGAENMLDGSSVIIDYDDIFSLEEAQKITRKKEANITDNKKSQFKNDYIKVLGIQENQLAVLFGICRESMEEYQYYFMTVDLKSLEKKTELLFETSHPIECANIFYNGKYLSYCDYEHVLIDLDRKKVRKTKYSENAAGHVYSLEYDTVLLRQNQKFVVRDTKLAKLYILDALSGKMEYEIDISSQVLPEYDAFTLAMSKSGKYLAVSGKKGIYVFSENGTEIGYIDLSYTDKKELRLSISDDDKYLFYIQKNTLYQCDLMSGEILNTLAVNYSQFSDLRNIVWKYDTEIFDNKTKQPVLYLILEAGAQSVMDSVDSERNTNFYEIVIDPTEFTPILEMGNVLDYDISRDRIYAFDHIVDSESPGIAIGYYNKYNVEELIGMARKMMENKNE